MNRRSNCFFIRVPGAAATCGQSGCEHVPPALIRSATLLRLPLPPRLQLCRLPGPPSLFIDEGAPPLPARKPMGTPVPPALSQWQRPSPQSCLSPPATAGAGWLVTRPPPPSAQWRPLAEPGGAAGCPGQTPPPFPPRFSLSDPGRTGPPHTAPPGEPVLASRGATGFSRHRFPGFHEK